MKKNTVNIQCIRVFLFIVILFIYLLFGWFWLGWELFENDWTLNLLCVGMQLFQTSS